MNVKSQCPVTQGFLLGEQECPETPRGSGLSAAPAPGGLERATRTSRMGHRAPQSLWLFLLQSQDCMASALACSKILKELAKEEEDTDTTDDMLALAEQYEHKAIGEREATSSPKLLSRPAHLACFTQVGSGHDAWCQMGVPSSRLGSWCYEGCAWVVVGAQKVPPRGVMSRSCCKGRCCRHLAEHQTVPGAQRCPPGPCLARRVHRLLPQG